MGFRDAIDVVHSKEYRRAVEYYVIKEALAVMSEDALTPNHAERVTYARQLLAGEVWVNEFAQAVASNEDIIAALLAGTAYIQHVGGAVEAMFNAFAGVST